MSKAVLDSDDWHAKVGEVYTRLHNTAHYLVDHGHYDQAIRCFESLSLGDDSYETGDYAYGIGRAYEGKGEIKTALDWYRIAHELNSPIPEFSDGILRMMIAIEAAGGSTEDGYKVGDYSFGRGRHHEAAGALDEAKIWYRVAYFHNPSDPEFRRAYERFHAEES
jgi:tetratricopeptide (TPR) repeat protein